MHNGTDALIAARYCVLMIRIAAVALCLVLASASIATGNKEETRLEDAGVVLEEVLGVPDNVPRELLDKAECVIVIPSMLKVAFGIGGNYGRGAMACRTGSAFDGPWGAPAISGARARLGNARRVGGGLTATDQASRVADCVPG